MVNDFVSAKHQDVSLVIVRMLALSLEHRATGIAVDSFQSCFNCRKCLRWCYWGVRGLLYPKY